MRRVIAFFTALVFFGAAVLGMHRYGKSQLEAEPSAVGTWTSEAKFKSWEAIRENVDENTMVVFGSSELEHGKGTPFHPEAVFSGQEFHTMLIGAGYYQSLSHAITLSAIAPAIQNQKAVLILSPQWFRKKGVPSKAYASRFSESSYVAMLKNKNLSQKTKDYIAQRTITLLEEDPKTQERVKSYNKIYLKKKGSLPEHLYCALYSGFMDEKAMQTAVTGMKADGISSGKSKPSGNSAIDFERLRAEAEAEGAEETKGNEFNIKDKYFSKLQKKGVKKRENSGTKSSYSKSPEYDDLRCFLDVCRENGITPLLVNVPVNGWWYDYTGFSKEKRNEYYQNIRDIAKEYQVVLADYSDREYEKYFLEDTMHLGWKGWVDVSESIYNFAKQTEK